MSDFDVVIVGPGPSAIGALLGLNGDNSTAKRVAVVTGAANHSSGRKHGLQVYTPRFAMNYSNPRHGIPFAI